MMIMNAAKINWARTGEALPAFLTIALMPLTYSIAYGKSVVVVMPLTYSIAYGKQYW